MWAAMRFGLAGVSWALLAVAYQSTWGAVHGRGPFTSQTPAEHVLQLQCFLLASSLRAFADWTATTTELIQAEKPGYGNSVEWSSIPAAATCTST